MTRTFFPSTPPAELISSTASIVPSWELVPKVAVAPVIEPYSPSTISLEEPPLDWVVELLEDDELSSLHPVPLITSSTMQKTADGSVSRRTRMSYSLLAVEFGGNVAAVGRG